MGYYINPKDCSKEIWLDNHSSDLPNLTPPNWEKLQKEIDHGNHLLPVCLVNNGPFTAAGICYNQRELEEFSDPRDYRSKLWYLVSLDNLIDVCPELEFEFQ